MKVGLWARAVKDLKKIPKIDQMAIARKIRRLEEGREKKPTDKLRGLKNVGRIRVGHYRLVFLEIKDGIDIFLIAHRREVYNLLKRLL